MNANRLSQWMTIGLAYYFMFGHAEQIVVKESNEKRVLIKNAVCVPSLRPYDSRASRDLVVPTRPEIRISSPRG